MSLQLKPISLHLWGFCQGLQDKYWSGIIWQWQPVIEIWKDKWAGLRRKTDFEDGCRRYGQRLLHLHSWFSWCHCRNRDIIWQYHSVGWGIKSLWDLLPVWLFLGTQSGFADTKWLFVRLFLPCSSAPAQCYSHPMSQPLPGTVCPCSSCDCVPRPWGIPEFREVGEKPKDISAPKNQLPPPGSWGLTGHSEALLPLLRLLWLGPL